MSWREIAWNGVRFSTPAVWEVAKIGPRYLLLADQGEPALEIKWAGIKGRFSHQTALKRLKSLHRDTVQEKPSSGRMGKDIGRFYRNGICLAGRGQGGQGSDSVLPCLRQCHSDPIFSELFGPPTPRLAVVCFPHSEIIARMTGCVGLSSTSGLKFRQNIGWFGTALMPEASRCTSDEEATDYALPLGTRFGSSGKRRPFRVCRQNDPDSSERMASPDWSGTPCRAMGEVRFGRSLGSVSGTNDGETSFSVVSIMAPYARKPCLGRWRQG